MNSIPTIYAELKSLGIPIQEIVTVLKSYDSKATDEIDISKEVSNVALNGSFVEDLLKVIKGDAITYLFLKKYIPKEIQLKIETKINDAIKSVESTTATFEKAMSAWCVMHRLKNTQKGQILIDKLCQTNPCAIGLMRVSTNEIACMEVERNQRYIDINLAIKETLTLVKKSKPVMYVRTTDKNTETYRKLEAGFNVKYVEDSELLTLKGICVTILTYSGFTSSYNSIADFNQKLKKIVEANKSLQHIILIDESTTTYKLKTELMLLQDKAAIIYNNVERCLDCTA